MNCCDVLIVGGGPAGTSLAWGLRDSGMDICVMDKQSFPRDKVCAGWITPAVIKALEIDTQHYQANRTFQPINGFLISQIGQQQIETRYHGDPISFGIRRCEFDQYLLQRSKARVLLNTPFKNMRRDNKHWIVNENIRTSLVVGAGGHFCPVARVLGAKLGCNESAVTAQEIEFEMSPAQRSQCNVDPEIPELFFCEDLAGYGWIFRKGDFLNVGLGREDNHKLTEHVQRFSAIMKSSGKIPADMPGKFHGHAYLLYQNSPRKMLDDGVFLIGDAAGLAYAQSGEGIRPAVESGLLGAKVIRNAAQDYRRESLNRYIEHLISHLGNRQSLVNISHLMPEKATQYLGAKLLLTHWFIRHIVMNRWFLHTQQSPLLSN